MKRIRLLLVLGLAVLALYLGFAHGSLSEILNASDDGGRRLVFTSELQRLIGGASHEVSVPDPTQTPTEDTPPPVQPSVVPTTISGGFLIKNSTDYDIDFQQILSEGCSLRLPAGEPQILIIHTHSSEAYTPAGLDRYEASGDSRTLDQNFSVIRVGNELTEIFRSYGLNVIHDTGVYDYPSYTGSYNRSGAKVEEYLAQYPTIKIVIDLHRDALGSSDVLYKVVADEEGVCASQVMLFVGTDASGLEHPNWRQNLSLAVYIQNAVSSKYPSLMRPVQLVKYRYNQHLTPGSMIIEVGSNGNTLQEALAAIRLFGHSAGPALAKLVE